MTQPEQSDPPRVERYTTDYALVEGHPRGVIQCQSNEQAQEIADALNSQSETARELAKLREHYTDLHGAALEYFNANSGWSDPKAPLQPERLGAAGKRLLGEFLSRPHLANPPPQEQPQVCGTCDYEHTSDEPHPCGCNGTGQERAG